jgi:hypothetical protein
VQSKYQAVHKPGPGARDDGKVGEIGATLQLRNEVQFLAVRHVVNGYRLPMELVMWMKKWEVMADANINRQSKVESWLDRRSS